MTFEYKLVTEPPNLGLNSLQNHFDELGRDGWELVGILGLTFIFKRQQSRLVPVTNIVMLVRGRPLLTGQALDSLYAHTREEDFNLTVVHDAKDDDFRVRKMLHGIKRKNFTLLSLESGEHVLARAKNIGVAWSDQTFGRGEWLYLSDNDVWFAEDWLGKLTSAAEASEEINFALWGGQVHPFHKLMTDFGTLSQHSILDGPSWLMRWWAWDSWGPFDRNCAPGACQSEEYPWCERLKADGKRIGVIHPHVIVHTGLTQTDGKPAPGAEQRKAMIPSGVIAE